jgi:hypothetical protein
MGNRTRSYSPFPIPYSLRLPYQPVFCVSLACPLTLLSSI